MHIHMTEKVLSGSHNFKRRYKIHPKPTEKIMSLKGVEHVKLTSTGIRE